MPVNLTGLDEHTSCRTQDRHASTSTKSDSTFTLRGLEPNTTYYIVVQAVTFAHDEQQNGLQSPPSEEVSATTEVPTAVHLAEWRVQPAAGFGMLPWATLAAGLCLLGYRRRKRLRSL